MLILSKSSKQIKDAILVSMGTFDKSPEAEAKRIAALRKSLTGKKCPPGCECGKHSAATRLKMSEAAKRRVVSDETKAKTSASSKAAWAKKSQAEKTEIASRGWDTREGQYRTRPHRRPESQPYVPRAPKKPYDARWQKIAATRAAWTPEQRAEHSRKMSNAAKQSWASGRHDNKRPAARRRVSAIELALAPYLEALGYKHNHDGHTYLGKHVPDFVDIKGRRVFEFYGNYWHRGEDPQVKINYYKGMGWTCEILWEQDTLTWLSSHQELVTGKQHQDACAATVIDPRYRRGS